MWFNGGSPGFWHYSVSFYLGDSHKRFTAAALAAATAISLASAPAQAADDNLHLRELNKPGGSSDVTDLELAGYFVAAGIVEGANGANITNNQGVTSSIRSIAERDSKNGTERLGEAAEGALNSSFKNDANNGYKLGTTFEILLGTGIAAVLLAALGGAAYAGVIPGVQLPF